MRVRGKLKNWFAEFRTALLGVVLAFRRRNYVISVIIAFCLFGTLMSLLSSGTAGLSLMFSGNAATFFNILGKAFLGLFGVGRSFTDWAVVFFISLLQAVVIGLVVLVWKKRKANLKADSTNADNIERAGLAAGLAVLGTGCPTCGTTLLMPVITAVVGGGGMALASTISSLLTVLAVIVLLFSFKKLGQEAYTILVTDNIIKHKEKTSDRKNH